MREIKSQNDLMDVLISDTEIIFFFNNWCPICKMVSFQLEEYNSFHKELRIACLNIGSYPELANQLNVKNVPQTFVYVDGELKERISGKLDLEYLDEILYSMGDDFF